MAGRRSIFATILTVCLLGSASMLPAKADGAHAKGMIMSRTGDTLVVNGPDGKATVVLTDDTKTKDDTGLFGLGTKEMGEAVLIPGLKVSVDGASDDQGRIVAETITVDGDDLETAEMIQAGLHPTAQQVEANVEAIENNKKNVGINQQNIWANKQNIESNGKQIQQNISDIQENTERFSRLDDYEVKGQATVKFDVGSVEISEPDLDQLKQLAQTAANLPGYIIEVKGFADSTGDAIMNEKLSEDRAKRVVAYLVQQCDVPLRHIVAPGAMGEYQPAASNETKEGRAENRRVEVKVLVNKGVSGT